MTSHPPIRDPHLRRLAFRLTGSLQDEGYVRANEFVDFLDSVIVLLRKLEGAGRGPSKIIYRVVELEVGSAAIAFEAEPVPGGEVSPSQVLERFAEGATAYRDGTLPISRFEPDVRDAFGNVFAPLRRNVRQLTVALDGVEIEFGTHDLRPLQLTETTTSAAVGSFSGYVDAINVHREPVFYLYPIVGPSRIACIFDRGLLEQVRPALKRYTTVFGLLEYVEESAFPARIVVDRVEVNPPANELPTLQSLWGVAPDFTLGTDAVNFVRRYRDAED